MSLFQLILKSFRKIQRFLEEFRLSLRKLNKREGQVGADSRFCFLPLFEIFCGASFQIWLFCPKMDALFALPFVLVFSALPVFLHCINVFEGVDCTDNRVAKGRFHLTRVAFLQFDELVDEIVVLRKTLACFFVRRVRNRMVHNRVTGAIQLVDDLVYAP